MLKFFGRRSQRGGDTQHSVAGPKNTESPESALDALETRHGTALTDGNVPATGKPAVESDTSLVGISRSDLVAADRLPQSGKSRTEPASSTGVPRPVARPDLLSGNLSAHGLAFTRLPNTTLSTAANHCTDRAVADATLALHRAFTPTTPAQCGQGFVGRARELRRVVTAIEEEHAHVVIVGGGALGKTSVANCVAWLAKQAGYWVARSTTGSDSSFEATFRSLLRQVPPQFIVDIGPKARTGVSGYGDLTKLLPPRRFGSDQVVRALCQVQRGHLIFLIDEFDRVTNGAFRARVVETMKGLSDVSARINLIVVGVGHSAQELLGDKVMSLRSVITVRVPMMTPKEIDKLIHVGGATAGIAFDVGARAAITRICRGSPYTAQLLCLRSARSALARGDRLVQTIDLEHAIAHSLCDTEHQFVERYERATEGERNPSLARALAAAAICASDEYGGFTAADAAEVLNGEVGTPRVEIPELHRVFDGLTRPKSGRVIERRASVHGLKFFFGNEIMRQYVIARHFGRNGSVSGILRAP